MNKLQEQVGEIFRKVFGRTPLKVRLQDILGEAIELSRATDIANLREELGDLLASALQLCNEMGVEAEVLLDENLAKVQRRNAQYKARVTRME